ncbi:MAG: hypothetical protein HY961_05295 [Ignavibacteriae bacterium]|nr:hypothetical protein [Ignavibacteriota bacterium]
MKPLCITSLIVVAALLIGCEKNSLGTIDVRTDIPMLTNASATPDSIYLDSMTPDSGKYTIVSVVKVKMAFQNSSPTVSATVLQAGATNSVATISLRDDGVTPDAVAHDSVYSANVQFKVTRAQAGRYRVRIVATLSDGSASNTLEKALKLGRRNARPQITNVSVPDSVSLPATDTLRIQFTASVADSDGLADIREVFFKRVSPPDPTKFLMRDDGSLDPPVNIGGILLRSGDDISGDGKFSFLIPVLPTSTRRTNVFDFQCIDSFGDTSNTVQRSFTIR